jgi:hypothetical protein
MLNMKQLYCFCFSLPLRSVCILWVLAFGCCDLLSLWMDLTMGGEALPSFCILQKLLTHLSTSMSGLNICLFIINSQIIILLKIMFGFPRSIQILRTSLGSYHS